MDTGFHMWISPSNKHLHMENVMFPVGWYGWCDGTGSQFFYKICCELSHEKWKAVNWTIDDLTSSDPMEMASVLAAIGGCERGSVPGALDSLPSKRA